MAPVARIANKASARYLEPYERAVALHGPNFASLRWTSEQEQLVRFDAMTRIYPFSGKMIVDGGCGRADFFDHLTSRGIVPAAYTGVEAVLTLFQAAERKTMPAVNIIHADFVLSKFPRQPPVDVVTFSGSLNTLKHVSFYTALRDAGDVCKEAVVFNFLTKRQEAHAPWLTWHEPEEVLGFARSLSRRVDMISDYRPNDMTVAIWRPFLADSV